MSTSKITAVIIGSEDKSDTLYSKSVVKTLKHREVLDKPFTHAFNTRKRHTQLPKITTANSDHS
jgi:hypothetical protein